VGLQVETATTDDDGPGRAAQRAVSKDNGVARRTFARTTRTYTYAATFPGWLRQHIPDYDIVHVHAVFSHLPMAAARIARAHGVPYLLSPHGMLLDYGLDRSRFKKALSLPLIEVPALRGAAAVHVTAAAERDEIARRFGWDLPFALIPLGVEAARAGSRERFVRRFPELAGSGPRLLFLSRVDPKKNLEALIDAIARLDDLSGGPARLVVCGAGDEAYVAGLRQRAEALGVAEQVIWAGFVKGEVKADALAWADLYVLPSYSENFGVAPVEAMLAGIPCVLGEGVAIAGEVAAAGAGLAIAPSAEATARAVRALLEGERLAAAGAAARAFARERYAPAAMGRALAGLYRQIVAAPERPTSDHV
jgi:glycosyltransferase involved in cell wall biosynthesis